jgi:hypothetical protein
MTLREYAQLTQPKIGVAADDFFELTTLTEKTLYSSHEPEQKDVEKAEEIHNTLRRKLNTETN